MTDQSLRVMLIVCVLISGSGIRLAADEPNSIDGGNTGDYLWDKERYGWQVGAKLLSATGKLLPGDPVVIQFVLKNVSDQQQTVVIQQYENTHPTLGAGNRIALNIMGSSQRRYQHILGPGEILENRQYRVTVSTAGLPPGVYSADTQPAFWTSDPGKPNTGTGIGRNIPVPFVLGDPDAKTLSEIPAADSEPERIYWGEPVAGLVVGMRLPNGFRVWPSDSRIEAQMFVRNLSQAPIEFEYEIPALVDWNMSVTSTDGKSVRLDHVWYTGMRPQVKRKLTLAPEEQAALTGVEWEVRTQRLDKIESGLQRVPGPTLQILKQKTEFEPGDPKRLITTQGDYQWSAYVTVHQTRVKDLSMVIGSRPVPFSIKAD